MDITDLLTAAVEAGASDLHLKSGNYPMMRVHSELRPIVEDCRLSPTAMDAAGSRVWRASTRWSSPTSSPGSAASAAASFVNVA